MFSWFTSLFSSNKAVDTISDLAEKGASGIDKIFYTPEEKAIASQKYFDTWLEFQKGLQQESTPTAISRRILAFMIMGTFLFLLLLGVLVNPFYSAWSIVIFSAVEKLSLLAEAVGATYFIKDAIVKSITASKQ